MTRVLVVDDDLELLDTLRLALERDGYEVMCATNADEAFWHARNTPPDAVILDILLPGTSGWDICRRLRGLSKVPILFLSGKVREVDVVKGLAVGGDDYVTKPFGMAELKARLVAIIRRAGISEPRTSSLAYDDGDLSIDLDHGVVTKGGSAVALTPKELQVLSCLVRRQGRIVTYDAMLREIWGEGYEDEIRYLQLFVRYLRIKLEDDPSTPRYILTRFGVGYTFHTGDS